MTIADVLAVLAALVLVGLAFPSLFAAIGLVFPKAIDRGTEQIATHPVRTFGTGIVTLIGLLVLAGVMKAILIGPLKALGVLVLLGGLWLVALGAAALVHHLAHLLAQQTATKSPLHHIFLGTFLLEFSILTPFVGWLVVLPVVFFVMLGTGVHIVWSRPKPTPVVQATPYTFGV